jgi:hypothetical protein
MQASYGYPTDISLYSSYSSMRMTSSSQDNAEMPAAAQLEAGKIQQAAGNMQQIAAKGKVQPTSGKQPESAGAGKQQSTGSKQQAAKQTSAAPSAQLQSGKQARVQAAGAGDKADSGAQVSLAASLLASMTGS